MSEDTRKDRRAKIVSLNVRYKSATVDEFIENHSHDVSKGGIFIKTPTPFPPGTLIKFEIRIANDKAVIVGVGRVVWKREASQAAGERPSGMGVKFIKIDDSSRHLIDRVVAGKEGAGAAYSAEDQDGAITNVRGTTLPVSDGSDRPNALPGSLRPGEARKETIMGIGASSPPQRLSQPVGGTAVGMFPSTNSTPETGPVKEKTVMKQAAELLEEALKEVGGSMDEIGTNPLFTDGNKSTRRVLPVEDKKKGTLIGMPEPATRASPAPKPASEVPESVTAVRSMPVSSSPPTVGELPKLDFETDEEPPSSRQRKTDPPAAKSTRPGAVASLTVGPPKGTSSGMLWLLALVIVLGGVAFVYKDNLLGTRAAPPRPPPALPPSPAISALAPPTSPIVTGSAAVSTPAANTSTTAPSVSASAAVPESATKPTPANVVPLTPAAIPEPAPKPRPQPATPTAASTDTAAAAPPAPAPKPKPKPKPTAAPAPASDDNPY